MPEFEVSGYSRRTGKQCASTFVADNETEAAKLAGKTMAIDSIKSATAPPAAPNSLLRNCRACGHQVAIGANACPSCGASSPAMGNRALVICGVLGVVLTLAALLTVLGLLAIFL